MEKSVNGLWIGESLSTLQIISINSWIKNGFEFNLYTYENVKNVPLDVNLKDANDIIDKDKIFRYKDTGHVINGKPFGEGRVAGFSDWFRAKLLYQQGCIWVDMDVVCLRPFDIQDDYFFVKQNHVGNELSIATCFIYVKEKKSDVFEEWLNRIESFGHRLQDISWGDIGPDMLTDIVNNKSLYYFVQNKKTFCPIDYQDYHKIWTEDLNLKDSFGIHLWNAMWEQYEIDKEGNYTDSFFDKLKKKYL